MGAFWAKQPNGKRQKVQGNEITSMPKNHSIELIDSCRLKLSAPLVQRKKKEIN